jgi:hypothetical protein
MAVLPITLRVRLYGVCALYFVGEASLRFFAERRKQSTTPGLSRQFRSC